jgi:hypothetical protein
MLSTTAAQLSGLDHAITVAVHVLQSLGVCGGELLCAERAVAVRIQPLQPALLTLGAGFGLSGVAMHLELSGADDTVAIGVDLGRAQRRHSVDLGCGSSAIAVDIQLGETLGALRGMLRHTRRSIALARGRTGRHGAAGESGAEKQGQH